MYKKFPGAEKMLAPATPADAPASVRTAVRLMCAGAAISTVSLIIALFSLSGLKAAIHKSDGKLTTAQINQAFEVYVVSIVVFGLIGVALWLVMARGATQGRRWSQIISTVLFALYTVDALANAFQAGAALVTIIFVAITWMVGAATIYLLWKPETKAYFNPRLARSVMPGVVLTAVPTPFTPDGELDTGTARRLIEFTSGATDGMLVGGSTAEFPALDDSERLTLIETALEVAGPDRVIAHVGAPDARRATRLAAAAVRRGARLLAAITPFYNAVTPAELRDYYLRLRAAAPEAELYIYIFPERTGRGVPVDEFATLASDAGLAGAKLSGAASEDLAACVAACPSMRVYAGSDRNLAGVLRAGGAGVISARSAAFPEVFTGLAAALASGDSTAADHWQSFVDDLVAVGASVGRVKEALRLRGFGPIGSRMPIDWPDEAIATEIAHLVKRLT
jgi:4-hydroxy-tetrahydrodipicolinate synthase